MQLTQEQLLAMLAQASAGQMPGAPAPAAMPGVMPGIMPGHAHPAMAPPPAAAAAAFPGFGGPPAHAAPVAMPGFAGPPAGMPQQRMANPFAGSGDADAKNKLPDFDLDFDYVATITRGEWITPRDTTKGQALLTECRVENSNDPQCQVGSQRKIWTKANDMFGANWKSICFAAWGLTLGNPEHEANYKGYVEAAGTEFISGAAPTGLTIIGRQIVVRPRLESMKPKNVNGQIKDTFKHVVCWPYIPQA